MKQANKVEVKTDKEVCQFCKYHENKPSRCLMVLGEVTFKGRKETCEFFHKS